MKYKSFSIVTVIAVLFLLFACEENDPFSPNAAGTGSGVTQEVTKGGNGRGQVTVMTWNIYVGADVDAILAAAPEDIPDSVAVAYAELLSTNFEERAGTIAQFIQEYEPDLIGLQEVSLIQRFSDVPPSPGNLIEQFDYLEILLNKLEALGLNYQMVDSVNNADVIVPRLANDSPPTLDYVRLLDSDVVLARSDVQTSNVIKGNYQVALPTPFGFDIPRGYVTLKATIGQKTYRFVSTHLESYSEEIVDIRMAQAQELVGVLSGETLPIIMVGDFNTYAPSSLNTAWPTYNFLVGSGYTDVWPHNLVGSEGEGFTAPHASDLRNPISELDRRIDLIFVRNQGDPAGQNEIGPVQAFVLGDELDERTPSGMWPSDHAGVVAKLHIQAPAQLATSNSTASAY